MKTIELVQLCTMIGETKYPQFRKYTNNKSFFIIEDEKTMVEYQIIGSRYSVYRLEVKILPERNLLEDVLNCADDRWKEISENEF